MQQSSWSEVLVSGTVGGCANKFPGIGRYVKADMLIETRVKNAELLS